MDTLHRGRLLPTRGGHTATFFFFLFFSSFCFWCGHRPLRWTHRTQSGNRPLKWTHRPGDKATAHDRCTYFPRTAIAHQWWTHCSHIRLACRCHRVILHTCCVFNSTKLATIAFHHQKVQQSPTEVDTLPPRRPSLTRGRHAAPYSFVRFLFLSSKGAAIAH